MPGQLDTVRHLLPAEFLSRLAQIWGPARLDGVLASLARPKQVGFRVNPLRGPGDEVWQELADLGIPVRRQAWFAEAAVTDPDERSRLLTTSAVAEGRVYVQNLSSMLAVLALNPLPGQEILDLAAAPGGKTLLIVARMQRQGRVAAVEVVRERFYKLRANLQHHGAEDVKLYLADGRTIGRKTPERFHAVLLDAPCSAEARFHVDRPDSWQRWSLRKIGEQARKQVGLLRSALESVQVGGQVLYCTCSMSPEENELVVQHQLDQFPASVDVDELELPGHQGVAGLTQWGGRSLDPRLARARRVVPDDTWDAFFLCRLRKTAPLPGPAQRRKPGRGPWRA